MHLLESGQPLDLPQPCQCNDPPTVGRLEPSAKLKVTGVSPIIIFTLKFSALQMFD